MRINRPHILTDRQRLIMGLIADGHSMKQIARLIHSSEYTVKTHVLCARGRLNASTIAQAVDRCHQFGIFDWVRTSKRQRHTLKSLAELTQEKPHAPTEKDQCAGCTILLTSPVAERIENSPYCGACRSDRSKRKKYQ